MSAAIVGYLEELLENKRSVSLPDFGSVLKRPGSTTEYFFNSILKFDDGVLTDHIIANAGVDKATAQGQIKSFIAEVEAGLSAGGNYKFGKIGTMLRAADGKISFEPASGIQAIGKTPELMDAPKVKANITEEHKPDSAVLQAVEKKIQEEAAAQNKLNEASATEKIAKAVEYSKKKDKDKGEEEEEVKKSAAQKAAEKKKKEKEEAARIKAEEKAAAAALTAELAAKKKADREAAAKAKADAKAAAGSNADEDSPKKKSLSKAAAKKLADAEAAAAMEKAEEEAAAKKKAEAEDAEKKKAESAALALRAKEEQELSAKRKAEQEAAAKKKAAAEKEKQEALAAGAASMAAAVPVTPKVPERKEEDIQHNADKVKTPAEASVALAFENSSKDWESAAKREPKGKGAKEEEVALQLAERDPRIGQRTLMLSLLIYILLAGVAANWAIFNWDRVQEVFALDATVVEETTEAMPEVQEVGAAVEEQPEEVTEDVTEESTEEEWVAEEPEEEKAEATSGSGTEKPEEKISIPAPTKPSSTGKSSGKPFNPNATGGTAVNTSTASSSGFRYHVIAGCFNNLENADKLVQTLKSKGYNASNLGQIAGLYNVAFESYTDKDEAYQSAKKISDENVSKAWVLYLRKE